MKISDGHCPLNPGERIDDLQRDGYVIIQNPDKFCFGVDAVLLSGFARIRDKDCVLDMGTGNGIIPILLAAKTGADSIVGLEIQPDSADMAQRSVRLNNLEDRVRIVQGDIKEAVTLFGQQSFTAITCNPPYMIGQHGLINESRSMAIARHEIACTLEDIIFQGSRLLRECGRFFMVHRPFRLVEIVVLFTKYGLEPKRMRFVQPYADKEPNLVLIEAVKGGRSRVTVEKPLIIYRKPHVYTDEVLRVYKKQTAEDVKQRGDL